MMVVPRIFHIQVSTCFHHQNCDFFSAPHLPVLPEFGFGRRMFGARASGMSTADPDSQTWRWTVSPSLLSLEVPTFQGNFLGYTPNYSHLVGIMIINHWIPLGVGVHYFQTNPCLCPKFFVPFFLNSKSN